MIQKITSKSNNLKINKENYKNKKNLSSPVWIKPHQYGLKWLKENIKLGILEVCEADKGGSILLVPPTYLENKIKTKVENPDLYEKLISDPSKNQYEKIIQQWKYGKFNKFVTEQEAKQIEEITEKKQ